MNLPQTEKRAEEITRLVADLFAVDAYYYQQDQLVLSLTYRFDRTKSESLINDRLSLAGYQYELTPTADALVLTIKPGRKLRIPRLNIILFLVTLATVYIVPVLYFNMLGNLTFAEAFSATLADLAAGRGLEFTIALMSIVLIHEMGHFIASRRRGIITSWPYFIPAPNLIGTFGAIIKSKSPFWNRRDLIEVGAAGPIAGWIVAVGWLIYGLSQSIAAPDNLADLSGMAFSLDGESILIKTLVPILVGPVGSNSFYLFSEAAFAGWVGLLITALNMLPIGQLDGGHIVYGLTGRRQKRFAWLALACLVLLGFQSFMWWFFGSITLIMGVAHPPTMNDQKPLPRSAKIMGWVALVILVLSFTPVPFR